MSREIMTMLLLVCVLVMAPVLGAEKNAPAPEAGNGEVRIAASEEPSAGPAPAKTALDQQAEIYQSYERLVKVMDTVESRYVQPVEPKQLFEGAIKGIMESLDPYSNYIPAPEFKEFMEETEQQFSGIGLTVVVEKDRIRVQTTLEGMPAFRAGVLPGDYIVKVNDRLAEDIGPLDEVVKQLRGPAGSTVEVTFFRPSTNKEYSLTLTREDIPITTLRGYSADPKTNKWEFMIDDASGIGYIRMTKFAQNTDREFDEAYEALAARGMKGLVIDMRYNPGGLLDTAVAIADRFISEGLIVRTQGRAGIFNESYAKKGDDYKTQVKLVLLVNEWSASASEVLGGALKDHGRAVLVGTRSFGKGSVQNIIDLDGEGAIKLTVAYYYTPSGRLVHRLPGAKEWGLDPDVEQMMTTDGQMKLREEWNAISGGKAPALVGEGGSPVVDTQLARALDILRGMLLAERRDPGAK